MSYRTLEVEIENGRISAIGPEALPEKASGLLTILDPPVSQPRPADVAKGQSTVPNDFKTPLPDDILKAFKRR